MEELSRVLKNSDLVTNCPFPEASAVMGGSNPGWVFVDDLSSPRSLLVWAQGMEGFYLVGDVDNIPFLEDLDDYVEQALKPRLHPLGVTWFEVSGSENWDPVIEKVFDNRNLECSQQWVYTLKPSLISSGIIDDCRLLSVEQFLLTSRYVTNKELLFSKLIRFWGSVNAFLSNGIGYMLVCGDEIASLCFSAFVVKNVHVVDIETGVSHQRKGYGERVARAYLAESAERDYQLHWDCMAENTASLRLAEKLGLVRSHSYSLYSFPLY